MDLLLDQPNGQWILVAAETDATGAQVLALTTLPPDTWILVQQPNGEWAKVATRMNSRGIPTICVSMG